MAKASNKHSRKNQIGRKIKRMERLVAALPLRTVKDGEYFDKAACLVDDIRDTYRRGDQDGAEKLEVLFENHLKSDHKGWD